jgi:MFS superfamily sulfate permease-like transporter
MIDGALFAPEQGLLGHYRTQGYEKRKIEWSTVVLAIVIYAGWLLLTYFHERLPIALLIPAGGWLIAWHGSLQHETIPHPIARSTRQSAPSPCRYGCHTPAIIATISPITTPTP